MIENIVGIFIKREILRRQRMELMEWCAEQFNGMSAVFHRMRIERKLKRHSMKVNGRFMLTPAKDIPAQPITTPGHYLLGGFKR